MWDNSNKVQLLKKDGLDNSKSRVMVLHGEYASDPKGDAIEYLSNANDCLLDGDSSRKKNVVKGGNLLRSSTQVPSRPSLLNL